MFQGFILNKRSEPTSEIIWCLGLGTGNGNEHETTILFGV